MLPQCRGKGVVGLAAGRDTCSPSVPVAETTSLGAAASLWARRSGVHQRELPRSFSRHHGVAWFAELVVGQRRLPYKAVVMRRSLAWRCGEGWRDVPLLAGACMLRLPAGLAEGDKSAYGRR